MDSYDTVTIVVAKKGAPKHPDDGPGEWFKAHLVYGPGANEHIESSSGSPKEAVDFALDIWERMGRP
jgi:hypothetical protein